MAAYGRRAALAGAAVAWATRGMAAPWPDGPLKFIVPYPPGGASDAVLRLLQPHLAAALGGATIVIENRGGGGTSIGTGAVALARDGRTFGLTTDAISVNPVVMPDLPYDTLRDLAPVMLLGSAPLLLAVAPGQRPWRRFADLLGLPRVTAGTSGAGLSNLFLALAAARTGARLELVPYRGAGPLLNDALAGHVDLVVGTTSALGAALRGGQLLALAQAGAARAALLPEVPTFAELGWPAVRAEVNWGIVTSARTPPAAVAAMHQALAAALALPAVRAALEETLAMRVIASTPAEYGAGIAADIARWRELVAAQGIRLEP